MRGICRRTTSAGKQLAAQVLWGATRLLITPFRGQPAIGEEERRGKLEKGIWGCDGREKGVRREGRRACEQLVLVWRAKHLHGR
eukprot:3588668-Rhodomonas_salina.1